MLSVPRGALRACALLAVLVAAVAMPASSKMQTFPGGCRAIDTMDAKASGDAVALSVKLDGEELLGSDFANVSAQQVGPGMNGSNETVIHIAVPNDDPIVTADILTSRVDLKVKEDPLESKAWSTAEVAHLDVLNGTVTADVVKAWANALTDTRSANTHTDQSTIVGLNVAGLSRTDVAPGAQLAIPDLGVVGAGSFVKTYVRDDASRFPSHNSPLYVGDTTVTMLHIYLVNTPVGTLDVTVSKAHAHAETPTPFCGLIQSVEAAAYVARIRPELGVDTSLLVGEQHIGVVGGSGHQQVLGQQVPAGGNSLVQTNVSETKVNGTVVANDHSQSRAVSKVLGLCILQDGTQTTDPEDYGDCLIRATALRAESDSYASENGTMSWGTVTIVGLVVAGVDVCDTLGMGNENNVEGNNQTSLNVCKPPKDTKISIGPFTLFLNQRERDAPEPGHTGYYVRGLRIQGPVIGDIIVSRAYSAADFLEQGKAVPPGPLEGAQP